MKFVESINCLFFISQVCNGFFFVYAADWLPIHQARSICEERVQFWLIRTSIECHVPNGKRQLWYPIKRSNSFNSLFSYPLESQGAIMFAAWSGKIESATGFHARYIMAGWARVLAAGWALS